MHTEPKAQTTPPTRILLAVTGLTPQVVTETLYALACRGETRWIPHEVHLITTATGAENARLNLLTGEGWFHRLVRDYELPPIAFTAQHIHVLPDADGQPLDDIRTPEQNTLAADFITATVRRMTQTPDSELHVSMAGGRKTMGYYLGYALSLYGRAQDRLSHVLVSEPYETNRAFYYPTPYDHPIHARHGNKEITVDARNARVELADIPFVRLRDGLPKALLQGDASFSRTVAAARCGVRQPELVIDLEQRTASAGGEPLKLTAQSFALLAWMACRRKRGAEPVRCSVNGYNPEAAREFLATCRLAYGPHSSEYEGFEKSLAKGMDSLWFSPAKTRLHDALVRALGESGAAPYRIRAVGKRRDARFELTLAPQHIAIAEHACPPPPAPTAACVTA